MLSSRRGVAHRDVFPPVSRNFSSNDIFALMIICSLYMENVRIGNMRTFTTFLRDTTNSISSSRTSRSGEGWKMIECLTCFIAIGVRIHHRSLHAIALCNPIHNRVYIFFVFLCVVEKEIYLLLMPILWLSLVAHR